jgi:hypothetical protein
MDVSSMDFSEDPMDIRSECGFKGFLVDLFSGH